MGAGAWLQVNQKQYIIKGMAHGMALHLVYYKVITTTKTQKSQFGANVLLQNHLFLSTLDLLNLQVTLGIHVLFVLILHMIILHSCLNISNPSSL